MRRSLVLVFSLSAIGLTWPLITQLTAGVPLGSETSATVPFFNLWTLGWNAGRLGHGFRGYWQAPIFHPAPGAFAYSDPQPLTAPLAALLWPISPALAYNAILLGYLVLAGWVTCRLLVHRGLPAEVAVAGGLLVQALPFLTHERGVLQLQALFGPIWALDAFWELLQDRRPLRALDLAAAVAITFLTSEYYGVYLIGLLGVVALLRIGDVMRARSGGSLALAIVVVMPLVLPFAISQARFLQAMGFERSAASVERTSAWAVDYMDPSPLLPLPSQVFGHPPGANQPLYPGAGLTGLALMGLFAGVARRERRRWVIILMALATLFFMVSLGSHLQALIAFPSFPTTRAVPVLTWLRSPYRGAVVVQLILALLAAEGLGWVHHRRKWLMPVLAGMALLEIYPFGGRLTSIPDLAPPWAERIADAGRSVTLHLPWSPDRRARSYVPTTSWMLQSLTLESSMINGYSGFFPSMNGQLRSLLREFPSPAGLRALRALGVDMIVIHPGSLDSQGETRLQAELDAGRLEWMGAAKDVRLVGIPGSSFQPAGAYTGSWALRVNSTGRRLDVGAYAAVPDDRVYVFCGSTTPLSWIVTVADSDGERAFPVEARGCGLLFHGSDFWLELNVPVDLTTGHYEIRLINQVGGRVLARVALNVP